MPSVVFDEVTPAPSNYFLTAIDKLAPAAITGWGPTVTYLVGGAHGYEIKGTGLTYAVVGGIRVMTGGVITTISVNYDQMPALVLSGLSLNAATLQTALSTDAAGTNPAAVETLFLSLGWTYSGRASRDVLTATTLSPDGVAFNLSGNDTVSTFGGDDDFFLGSGNDVGFGGLGRDRLDGGQGRDTLSGDSGNDTLLGGATSDMLYGGTGNDSLDGGSESDRITGGTGRDTMTGGTGADTFLFALRDSQDQINDFTLGTDRIDLATGVVHSFTASGSDSILHYGTFGDQILLVGIDIVNTGAVTIL